MYVDVAQSKSCLLRETINILQEIVISRIFTHELLEADANWHGRIR